MLALYLDLRFNEKIMAQTGEMTRIGIGETDGYRYVAIEPPLTDEEIAVLDQGTDEMTTIRSYTIEGTVNTTQLVVSGDFDALPPHERTRKAQKVADGLAQALHTLRGHWIVVNLQPVELQGAGSTPFNPNTDRL